MKQARKEKKPAQKTKNANVKARPNTRDNHQKKVSLVLAALLVIFVLSAVVIPVSYIPLLNNIAHNFGLSSSVTRQLTLLDLALDSLGVETERSREVFKQHEVNDAPSPILYSHYEPEVSHLINARETYYHEFERTRRRPAEVAGIYKDGKEVSIPNLKQGKLSGVRSLPAENYLNDDSVYNSEDYESEAGASRSARRATEGLAGSGKSSSFKLRPSNGTVYTEDEIAAEGSAGKSKDSRKTRKSFDKDGKQNNNTESVMPNFVSTVYETKPAKGKDSEEAETQTVDINNSRMIRPVFKGSTFDVSKRETPMATLMGSADFVKNLSSLRFGGYGTLGFFVADNIPESSPLSNLKNLKRVGNDALNAYFYSYLAPRRKYQESAKYLADVAFTGEEVQEQVLVSLGQGQTKPPVVSSNSLSPIEIQVIDENREECAQARRVYLNATAELKKRYQEKKNDLKRMTEPTAEYGWEGAPGNCATDVQFSYKYKKRDANGQEILNENGEPEIETGFFTLGSDIIDKREAWNLLLHQLEQICHQLENQERLYMNNCGITYEKDPDHDVCESIRAFITFQKDAVYRATPPDVWEYKFAPIIEGIADAWTWSNCHEVVRWVYPEKAHSIDVNTECTDESSCKVAIDKLFKSIDSNIVLIPNNNFF